MKSLLPAIARLGIFCAAFGAASGAAGQGNGSVVESQPFTPGQSQARSSQPGSGGGNSDALSLLLEQNQQLRTEVQALRGLLEEQGFEIRKMQRDSLSRYTNVDQRLSTLESAPSPTASLSQAAPPAISTETVNERTLLRQGGQGAQSARSTNTGIRASNSPTLGANPNSVSATTPPVRSTGRTLGRGTLQPAVLSEQQLYQMAYDSVINSDFQLSIAEFDQYLSIYPEGRFITNAHYWKGQAYLYLSRFEEARDSYEIILSQYADSPKLPDAMYGLGLAYQGLGNISQAKQILNDIKRRFPNTGVANLADTRLLSLD